MSVFDDLGVMVDGLEDDTAEEFDGDVEEIFRFNVFLTKEQEIEIEVNMQELMVEGVPEFGEAYSFLARTYADLVVEHIGMGTEQLMNSVAELPAQNVRLTAEEEQILHAEGTGDNGSVLLYSFPVLIMADDENSNGYYDEEEKQMGAGFERSQKAEIMGKVYGEAFREMEDEYQDQITDAVLDHGTLFIKAVEAIQKL
ncbi:MAG: hypothetical protein IJJ21_06190 [Firmicutes bacterium]|nr:hypothetical protein [Bacillota bacterium]